MQNICFAIWFVPRKMVRPRFKHLFTGWLQVASLMVLLQRLRPPSVSAATPHPPAKRRAFVSVGTPAQGLAGRTPFRDVTNVRQLKFKHQD